MIVKIGRKTEKEKIRFFVFWLIKNLNKNIVRSFDFN